MKQKLLHDEISLWFFIFYMTVVPLFEFLLGVILIRYKLTHKFGCHLWALSGLFLKYLPRYCKLTCDSSCKLWNCPRFNNEKETTT